MILSAGGCAVAFRTAEKQMQRYAVGALHSTSKQSDFFSWFRKKKEQEADSLVATQDTKELIKDIESGKKSKISNREKLDLRPENFIGDDSAKIERKARQALLMDVPFNVWLNGSKVANDQQLKSIAIESFNAASQDLTISSVDEAPYSADFTDLVTKFNFTKLLQARTGYLIPDNKLTILNSPSQFVEFYCTEIISGKSSKFKESEPHAINLSTRHSPPNVYIAPDIDAKSQKKRFGKIMYEAQSLEAEHTKKSIELIKRI